MSRFTDLQKAYSDFRKRSRDHYRQSQGLIVSLSKSLRTYTEAPESYSDLADGTDNPQNRPYVSTLQARRNDFGEFEYTEHDSATGAPDLLSDEKGRWLSGLVIVIDQAQNSYPKMAFHFPLAFTLADPMATVSIVGGDGQEFTFNVNETNGPHKLFDAILKWLDDAFSGTSSGGTKPPMGFPVYERANGK